MSENTYPYRRLTDPYIVPATDVASKVAVGAGDLAEKGVNSFQFVNSYPVWIRFKGSTGAFSPVEDHKGWLIPPGSVSVYSTQYPDWVSAMAVERPGFPIKDAQGNLLYPDACIELNYGGGA